MKFLIKNSLFIKILFLCILIVNTNAEYRAYQYLISSKNIDSIIVTTTYNPTTYLAINGGSKSINISKIRSWMCFGHTAFKKICSPTYNRVFKDKYENKE